MGAETFNLNTLLAADVHANDISITKLDAAGDNVWVKQIRGDRNSDDFENNSCNHFWQIGFNKFVNEMPAELQAIFEHGFSEKISWRFIPNGLAGLGMAHLLQKKGTNCYSRLLLVEQSL
jgi:hypothetical protein